MIRSWRQRRPVRSIVAFDLPGHGRSAWLERDQYNAKTFANILAPVLAEIGLTHPILIGHSLGARVAIELVEHDLNVTGLVLVDFSPDKDQDVEQAVAAHIEALAVGAPNPRGLVDLMTQRLPLSDPAALEALTDLLHDLP